MTFGNHKSLPGKAKVVPGPTRSKTRQRRRVEGRTGELEEALTTRMLLLAWEPPSMMYTFFPSQWLAGWTTPAEHGGIVDLSRRWVYQGGQGSYWYSPLSPALEEGRIGGSSTMTHHTVVPEEKKRETTSCWRDRLCVPSFRPVRFRSCSSSDPLAHHTTVANIRAQTLRTRVGGGR